MIKYRIGIDISITSTAIYISSEKTDHILSYLNTNKVNKWANKISQIENIKIIRIDNFMKKDEYSDLEIQKINNYSDISDLMINDIKNIVSNELCEINIEGYSYSSKTSSINDIIALSTLIRINLLKNINCHINIISPKSLKLDTCKVCYGLSEIKRVSEKTGNPLKSEFKYINNDGIAGGSFKKHEMYKAVIDKQLDSIITVFLIDNVDILKMKKIPSPIDDIIDALLLSKIKK